MSLMDAIWLRRGTTEMTGRSIALCLAIIAISVSVAQPASAKAMRDIFKDGYRCTFIGIVCRQAPCFNHICVKAGKPTCRAGFVKKKFVMNCGHRQRNPIALPSQHSKDPK